MAGAVGTSSRALSLLTYSDVQSVANTSWGYQAVLRRDALRVPYTKISRLGPASRERLHAPGKAPASTPGFL